MLAGICGLRSPGACRGAKKGVHVSVKRPDDPNQSSVDSTGVANLDLVLGGGISRGTLVIVVGPPGSGKTTLANQMAFAAAHTGQRAMVLTALSEPTSKLIAHLRSFTFYDDELVGDMVQFLSLQQFLPDGLETTGDELVSAARHARASYVVLDGFRGVRGVDMDPQAARQFLYHVGTTLSVLGTTTIITSEADPRDPAFFPEATTADLIIGLHYTLEGVRQRRSIEAIKVRGGAPLSGLHGLALNADGAIVYPRLESRVAAASHGSRMGQLDSGDDADMQMEQHGELDGRASFGITGLDNLLSGGLTRGTSTMVVGGLGTGKTMLALHFALAGALAGEPTLLLSFRESRRQLILKAEPFVLGDTLQSTLAPKGALTLFRWAPVELVPDIMADQLMASIDELGIRRLVVDSSAELERAVAEESPHPRVDNYLAALVEALRMRGVTALFTKEVRQVGASDLDFSNNAISVMAENVLLLRKVEQDGQLRRLLSVIKMRFSAHATSTVHEFSISAPKGISVSEAPAFGTETAGGEGESRMGSRSSMQNNPEETA